MITSSGDAITTPQNVGHQSPSDVAPHPRRLETSSVAGCGRMNNEHVFNLSRKVDHT